MKSKTTTISIIILLTVSAFSVSAQKIEKVYPGIWKISYGEPESLAPTEFKEKPVAAETALQTLSDAPAPDCLNAIHFRQTVRGAVAAYTIDDAEKIYGFGLQCNSFQQRGMRRELRINDREVGDIGFGHASMPFFISSKGYGVLVNTARYTTFLPASQRKLNSSDQTTDDNSRHAATSPEELYQRLTQGNSSDVEFVVDGAQCMEVYIIAGPSVKEVVQRYNLFSGGGAIPPLWAMGFKYRIKNTSDEQQALTMMNYFRDNHMPCDMLGLEPGWQTASYSCSYAWNREKFPDPDRFVQTTQEMHYKLNLWEHAYVHPSSPIFNDMVPYSGDYTVWRGLVPDFASPEARKVFANYHEKTFVEKGVAAFKLDECDNSFQVAAADLSFPDIAQFPSGMDGVRYRQLFGLTYQQTLWDMFRKNNRRTLLDVRASYLFASPYSCAIYTDMYAHRDYVRMIINSGFCGLNFTPEVRDTHSDADYIRRVQTTLMSAQMKIDAWYLTNPPWLQYNTKKNNRNEFLPNHKELEQKTKTLIELRMSLIPYLYAAFARYHFEGIPPFRSMILDYPDDEKVLTIDDQYMMGDNLMCAPFLDGASTREVYFPQGTWYDFNTNKSYEGGQSYKISMSLDEVPLFVKGGTILPLAKPVQYITPETVFEITCCIYGNPTQPVRLFEDDGSTFDFEQGAYRWVELSWDANKKKNKGKVTTIGKSTKPIYKITDWIVK